MFLLKKILEAFLLPPGCMVLALGGIAFWLRRRERRAALVCAALALVVWGGTTKVCSDALMRPLEKAYKAPAEPKGDVIILLCGGFRGGRADSSASERLNSGTLERADAAYNLYKKTGLPMIISGGAPFSSRPESEAAAAYMEELGVPAGKLVPEKASRDTGENAEFSAKLCREKGYTRPLVVTSAYHMPRAVLMFRRAGAQAVPFPVAFRTGLGEPRFLRDWLPGSGMESRVALNEYLALAFYRFL